MFDNDPEPSVHTAVDGRMTGCAIDSSSDEAMAAPHSSPGFLVPTFSGVTRPALLRLTVLSATPTATQSEVVSQFLREVGVPPSETTGDIAAMRISLSNLLGGCQPPPSNS